MSVLPGLGFSSKCVKGEWLLQETVAVYRTFQAFIDLIQKRLKYLLFLAIRFNVKLVISVNRSCQIKK